MNLLEHFIMEIHSEEPAPIAGWVVVDVTVNCYGTLSRVKHHTTEKQWEIDKKNGFYLA